jgi:hypothetical protein
MYYYFDIVLDEETLSNPIDTNEILDVKWFTPEETIGIEKNKDVNVFFSQLLGIPIKKSNSNTNTFPQKKFKGKKFGEKINPQSSKSSELINLNEMDETNGINETVKPNENISKDIVDLNNFNEIYSKVNSIEVEETKIFKLDEKNTDKIDCLYLL